MNGCTFKTAMVTFALITTLFLSPLTAATGAERSAGCMSCHQGEVMQSDNASQTNHANPQHKKKQQSSQEK
jgi:hypothetical protein